MTHNIAFTKDHFTWNNCQMVPNPGVVLSDPEHIALMPWLGNAHSDMKLFEFCDVFIRDTTKPLEQRQRALYLSGYHGMGFDEPVTADDLQSYIDLM